MRFLTSAALLLGLCLCVLGSAVAQECSPEHGATQNGTCVCTTPRPSSGEPGWVGDDCTTPVYYHGVSAGATDVADACSGSEPPCTQLEPNQTVCFLADLQSLFSTSAHFGLLLGAPANGTLHLQGLLVNSRAGDGAHQPYPTSAAHYSFVLSAGPARPEATMYLDRSAVGEARPMGAYLCVWNVGAAATSFSLRAAALSCPFTLAADGTTAACGGGGGAEKRASSDTCAQGMCDCVGKWARPEAPVYQGLGFEDCTATCVALPADSGADKREHVEGQAPGTWAFFNFTADGAAAPADRFVAATVAATAATASDVEVYLRYWTPPGRLPTQHDARALPGDWRGAGGMGSDGSGADLVSSVALPANQPGGTWFLGVYVAGAAPASYDVWLSRSACPGGCGNERGLCEESTGVCTCAQPDFTDADCGSNNATLELGGEFVGALRAGWAVDHVSVEMGSALAAAPGNALSLVITASFSSAPSPLPEYVTARPSLLLSGVRMACDPGYAPLRLSLPEPGASVNVTVEASMVPSGTLFISVHNPLSAPYQVGYLISVVTAAHCINGCSARGACGDDGTCACADGYAGPDCSVDVAAMQAAGCAEGSLRRAVSVPGGSAYGVCVCAAPSNCSFTQVDASGKDVSSAHLVCDGGYAATGAKPDGIPLSDGNVVSAGGRCTRVPTGTTGGMVFFYCLLSIALFIGGVVGGKVGLERYQVYRANQAGGYSDLGGGGNEASLWDAFTGARRNAQNNDSW